MKPTSQPSATGLVWLVFSQEAKQLGCLTEDENLPELIQLQCARLSALGGKGPAQDQASQFVTPALRAWQLVLRCVSSNDPFTTVTSGLGLGLGSLPVPPLMQFSHWVINGHSCIQSSIDLLLRANLCFQMQFWVWATWDFNCWSLLHPFCEVFCWNYISSP